MRLGVKESKQDVTKVVSLVNNDGKSTEYSKSPYYHATLVDSVKGTIKNKFIELQDARCHFVCVEVLRPNQPNGSCRARSVYLITLLLDSPLSGCPVLCTFFRQKLTTALLESAEGGERP